MEGGGDSERRLLERARTTGRGVAAEADTGWWRRGGRGFVCLCMCVCV